MRAKYCLNCPVAVAHTRAIYSVSWKLLTMWLRELLANAYACRSIFQRLLTLVVPSSTPILLGAL